MRAVDLFSKHEWVVFLMDKIGMTFVNTFQKIISKGRKPDKIWLDQGGESYNKLFKKFLKISNIEMYSTYNEGKSFVAERFIRTSKNKIFKHITALSKKMFILMCWTILLINTITQFIEALK